MKKSLKFSILVSAVFVFFMICSLFSVGAVGSKSVARKNKFVPPEGKILLIIGQDVNTIDTYVVDAGVIPGGFMVYTSVQNMEGIYSPVDYGAGVGHFQYLIDHYPNTVIQIGLYMVDALDGVIEGLYDENIDKLGEWIKKADRPVYLRIGYEFDGPHNHYEPSKYVKAYRYIVDRLKANGVNNVAYVWHAHSHSLRSPIEKWYPGDEYVDWIGISYFSQHYNYMMPVIEFAKQHHKSVIIAETTPQGIGTTFGEGSWKRWFQLFFNFIAEKNIRAICYINSNWEEQPMWKGQGWGDARIQANKIIKKRWLDEIGKEKYLQASPGLYKILGYHSGNGNK